jgi:hypothetical protein
MSHVFQSFWVGETLSPYEKMCMRSFVDHGHQFHLYSYAKSLDVPSGVVIKDAADVLPQSECFCYKKGFGTGSYSAGSNLFRYLLLTRSGGWWVDTDVLCLTDVIPSYEAFFAHEDEEFVNGAVLYFNADDALINACLVEARGIGDNASWGELGPRLITKLATSLNRVADALPANLCYPIHYSEALTLLLPDRCAGIQEHVRSSLFLHLWNEIFRQAMIEKSRLPPRGSYLRAMADRHPVSGWAGEYILHEEPQALDGLAEWLNAHLATVHFD